MAQLIYLEPLNKYEIKSLRAYPPISIERSAKSKPQDTWDAKRADDAGRK